MKNETSKIEFEFERRVATSRALWPAIFVTICIGACTRDGGSSHAPRDTDGCVIDQEQPNTVEPIAWFSQLDLAQSFVPESSAICGTSIHLAENFGRRGDVTIQIWDGNPHFGAHPLRSGTATRVRPGEWAHVTWPKLGVLVSQRLFLTATCTDPEMAWSGDASNPYVEGTAFANAGYIPMPAADYSFRTHIDPCDVDVSQEDWNTGSPPGGTTEVAQSFTPTRGGIRGAAVRLLGHDSDLGGVGLVDINLWDTLPSAGGATLLASGQGTVDPADGWARVHWNTVPVTVGTTYFLEFVIYDFRSCAAAQTGDPYDGGSAWSYGTPHPNTDLTFETFAACELECFAGNVDAANAVVLTVNGQDSSTGAWVRVGVGRTLTASMALPPSGGSGRFVVHANWGAPTADTTAILPAGLGTSCFGMLLPAAGHMASPVAIWNNLGKTHRLGESTYFDGTPISDPPGAPTDFLVLPSGDTTNLPAGTMFTLEGLIDDPESANAKFVSKTNVVTVVIL